MFNIKDIDIFTFLNNIASGFIIVSPDILIEFVNETALKMLNLNNKVKGKKIEDILPCDTLKKTIEETINERKSIERIVTKVELPETGIIYLGFTCSPLFSKNNSVIGVIINFRNITKQTELENLLKYSELKYKMLIQNLHSPVFIISYDNYMIIESNKSAISKIGLEEIKLNKMNFIDLINKNQKKEVEQYLADLKQNHIIKESVEVNIKDANDNVCIFETVASILEIDDQKHIQVICFDITEKVNMSINLLESYNKLKETQELMVRAERLAAVGELSAGVSHEIKNRFQVIANAVSYIKSKVDLTNEALNLNINYIQTEVERGVKLINNLMDFARPHPPSKSLTDINELINNSIHLMKKQFDKKRISVKNKLNDIPPTLADYNLIHQVIVNFLKNAEESMEINGTLTIKTYTVNSKKVSKKFPIKNSVTEFIAMEIQDTGTGIEKENLSKIFTPFFSLKGPEGTGLGLSVSYAIIEQHHGFIDVTSKPGKGTTFIIYLPLIS